MTTETISSPVNEKTFSPDSIARGTWKVILHSDRIPPHAGMIFNGNYNSLTIKSRELNINSEVLIKTIGQKKIKAVFIKLKQHPVFSTDHQLEIFQDLLGKYSSVKSVESTCLSPIKLFLNEFYNLDLQNNDLLYEVVHQLSRNEFIQEASSLNVSLNGKIELPCYTLDELNNVILNERKHIEKD